MPWKYTDEFYREYTRTTWNDSAKAYVDLMGRLAPFRTEAIGLLAPQAGEMILDVGTGPGEPAISIARRVVPGGRVVGVDLSERMVALAVDAARSQEVANLSFEVMDSSRLDFPPSTFDAAVSCFGFQIFTDPDASARELVRVLKPHGRAVVSVWAPGASVPFLDVMVAPMLEQAEPDETGYLPSPYETGGPGEMVAFLQAAGFTRAVETRRTHALTFENREQYFEAILGGTPIGHSLAEEDPGVQRAILSAARDNLERYRSDGGYVLPAECVLVQAWK